jgi:uncharacterized membrane protein
VYPDVAELYWKLVGTEAPMIGKVTGTFTFPEGSAPLKAWAHGPLEGVVQPSGNVVTLEVAPLPANTFVEVRVAASPSAFTIPPSGGPRLPTIEAEEAQFAADANAERQRLKDELEREQRIRNFGAVAGPVLGVAAFFGFLAIWRAWGKEPEAPDDIGDYYREVPEEPPAVIEAFLGWGSVPRTAFGSTVVDLAQRGYLTIAEQVHEKIGKDEVEYAFTSTGKQAAANGCTPYEREVLDRLFSGGPTITQDELVDQAKDDRTEAVAWWEGFRKDVRQDLETHHYFNEKGRFRPYCLHSLLVLGAIGGGILLIVAGAVLGGIVLLVFGVVLMLLSGLLRQRTPEGARKQAEISGLRRFLRDFSRLDDAPVGDLILYERYLVYAVALGVSKELMQGLQARVPELANQTTVFAPWYIGSTINANRFDSLSSVGTFATHFSSATAAAFSPPSSASGGGGGFSVGGGGGGGGGGFGAH